MNDIISKKISEDTKNLAEDTKKNMENDSRLDTNNNIRINAIPDIVDDFLINTDTYEWGNKFDMLPKTKEIMEERAESNIAETLGRNIDFGPKPWVLSTIQLGKTILHFRRKREDYKIRVTDIDIEYKPGYILFKGTLENNKRYKGLKTKIARNIEEWTWFFI